ncbi:MAG: tetratricopeptide repeat protein [bacterium]
MKRRPSPLALRLGAAALFALSVGGASASQAPGASQTPRASGSAERKLLLALPEVIIESPDIERLVAQRVRPIPPRRLGVRIPKIIPNARVPEISPPPRPLPPEREPDPELANVMGGFSRFFGDSTEVFESGLAYLKKGAPVEALSYFDRTANSADSPRLKAAGRFWAAETLVKLGRPEEARRRRMALLKAFPRAAAPYRAAARYALAEGRCAAGDYEGCLKWLDSGEWKRGEVAWAEAGFLRAWALIRLGARPKALNVLSLLASEENPIALKVLVALAHLYFREGSYAKAERAYARAESMRSPRGKKDADLIGEALHGIGWTRLLLGRAGEAERAFSLFRRRHRDHVLLRSAEAGALASRIEMAPEGAGEGLAKFIKKYPENDQIGLLRLQLAWALFRARNYPEARKQAAAVSDGYPLGRLYRLGRIIEGLSLYHQGKIREAYGVLRTGADRPPAGGRERVAERSAARSAAMATAFAAFRLKDYSGAQDVLEHWAFLPGGPKKAKASDFEAALWYGEAAFEGGDLERARRAFEKIPRNAAEWYRAQAALAWIRYRKKEWRGAAVAFDRVFSMKPMGPLAAEALARAGEARFNLGDYSGALQAFERIEKEYAGGTVGREALLEKGKLLFRRNRLDGAERVFGRYMKKFPKSKAASEVEFWTALIWFRRGRYEDARRRLLAFADRYPGSPHAAMAYLRVGDSFYNEGRYLQADRLYRLMMNRYPGHARVRDAAYGLILTRLQQGNYSKFVSEARKFIESHEGDDLSIALSFQVGEIRLSQGDLSGALRAYREVEARYASNELAAHALLRISDIHRRRTELDAALDTYESLMVRYPKSPLRPDALFGMGETLASVGRCAEARERLGQFLKRFPGHDYVQIALYEAGRCAAKMGDLDAAAAHLKKLVEAGRGGGSGLRTSASLLLAALLSKRGKLQEAADALEAALLSEDPRVAVEAQFSRADLLARKKDRRAASEFLKLTYTYPGQTIWVARALARAGELYESAGRRATALRIFQKMRRVAPKGELRNAAQKAIARLSKKTAGGR